MSYASLRQPCTSLAHQQKAKTSRIKCLHLASRAVCVVATVDDNASIVSELLVELVGPDCIRILYQKLFRLIEQYIRTTLGTGDQ